MRDDAFGRLGDALVKRKVEGKIFLRRRLSPAHELSCALPLGRSMAGLEFVEVQIVLLQLTRLAEEGVFQHEFMKHDNPGMPAQHGAGAKVKTIVVAYVIDRRVIIFEGIEPLGVFLIVEDAAYRKVLIAGDKPINKQIDVGVRGEIRQQLFAVIRDTARLRIKRAEVSKTHGTEGRKQKAEGSRQNA